MGELVGADATPELARSCMVRRAEVAAGFINKAGFLSSADVMVIGIALM
ncbi:hypothetical protein [Kutzneria sp. CA-103260]|nr:hypothetical protein [Kutzneria sp. CA-103260]